MSDPAEELAKEVDAGTYSPSTLENCDAVLPTDRSQQVIRLTQFTLFSDPASDLQSPDPPKYLILQQYQTRPGGRPHKPIFDLIGPLADKLTSGVVSTGENTPPPRTGPTRVARSRRVVARSAPAPTTSPTTAPSVENVLQTLRNAGFAITAPAVGANKQQIVQNALQQVFLPEPYQPFTDPHPHIALLATYEQVWKPLGYTRGELITTIGLAPGEQLTLELHSWDKTAYKSQDELTTESELRLAQTSNQRDSLTVARETASQTSMSLNAGATIPIKTATVTLGGTASNQVSKNVKSTAEQTQQNTSDAAYSLKTSRKLNIEISREVGREQKQTRVISNTNRCHSLNCHYFEIMSSYLVTTELASLQPVLLVPTPRADVTPAWVLSHESVLKRALIDNVYLPGFDAARTLESESAYVEIQKIRGKVPHDFEDELKDLILDIGAAYEELKGSFSAVYGLIDFAVLFGGPGGVLPVITTIATSISDRTRLREFLYYILLAANRPAWHALQRLYKERNAGTPSHPLRAFLTMTKLADFQVSASAAAIAKGSAALNIPSEIVDGLITWGFLDLVPDDAGLFDTLQAVEKRLDEIWSLPSDGNSGGSAPGFADTDVATAHANFEQLRSHIDENWLHYAKAMWLSEDADSRFLRLQSYGAVAGALANEVLGFLGHKEAFAISDPAVITALDLNALITDVKHKLHGEKPKPRLVALPTPGSILESIVGECDACEDFIQQSRVIDLRVQDAKAKQEEAEAERRQMRLTATPPDLSSPVTLTAGGVTIAVSGQGTPAQP